MGIAVLKSQVDVDALHLRDHWSDFRKIVKKAVEELTRARAAQRKRVKDRELKSMISGFQVDPPC
jgi:hypothetical protein